MSKQEKKQQRIYELLDAETKPKYFTKFLKFLYGVHEAQTLTFLITQYGKF